MRMFSRKVLIVLLGLILGASSAYAAVSQEQAGRLGKDLTPVGGEKAGNAAGTIPAWEGGITTPPAGYKAGGHHPDPFPDDQPLFTIDRNNYKEYADQLSAGQKAMFEKYDTFKMNVYPTRRSAAFPQRTYEYTQRNATTARLLGDGEGVEDAAEGMPFPVPQNGAEAIWNHKMKYKGIAIRRWANQAAPTANGEFTLVRIREELYNPYFKPGNTIADIDNIAIYFYQVVEAPARLAGQVLLVHETLNQIKQPRQAWVYNPGQRRVRLAPNVAYDNPGTAADGLRTSDMADMFNGALDRFDWKLAGKREMYVPYNSYKVHSGKLQYTDIIRPGHLNPDLLRYELHRVWAVEATLKPGARHINSRRTFYLDEDSWQILIVDHYDGRGQLWRYSEAPSINYYEMPLLWSTLETHHDLQAGRYVVQGLDNQDAMYDFSFQTSPENFSPQALRTRGIR